MKRKIILVLAILISLCSQAQSVRLLETFKGRVSFNSNDEYRLFELYRGDPGVWSSISFDGRYIRHIVKDKSFKTLVDGSCNIDYPSNAKISLCYSNSTMSSDGSYLYFVTGTKGSYTDFFAGLYNSQGKRLYDFSPQGSADFTEAVYYDGSWKFIVLEMDMSTYQYNSKVYELRSSNNTSVSSVVSEDENESRTYNSNGIEVSDDYRGIVVTDGKKYLRK